MDEPPMEAPEFIVLQVGRIMVDFVGFSSVRGSSSVFVDGAIDELIQTYSIPRWDQEDVDSMAYAFRIAIGHDRAYEEYLEFADALSEAIYRYRVHELLYRFEYHPIGYSGDGQAIILQQNLH